MQTPGAPVPASARGITRQNEGTCEGSPASVVISPASATVFPGGTQQFTATVPGLANQNVTWSATGGTITAGGLYTAGNTGDNPGGTFRVTATSVAQSGLSASATVTVVRGAWVGPFTNSLLPNSTSDALVIIGAQDPETTLVRFHQGSLVCPGVQFLVTLSGNTFTGSVWAGSFFPCFGAPPESARLTGTVSGNTRLDMRLDNILAGPYLGAVEVYTGLTPCPVATCGD